MENDLKRWEDDELLCDIANSFLKTLTEKQMSVQDSLRILKKTRLYLRSGLVDGQDAELSKITLKTRENTQNGQLFALFWVKWVSCNRNFTAQTIHQPGTKVEPSEKVVNSRVLAVSYLPTGAWLPTLRENALALNQKIR